MSETTSSGWMSAAAGGGMIIAPIVSSLISANAAKKAQGRQNRYGKKESELAYQRDLEMMRLQNEYNTPANQMARYDAAGLNRNLIYSQGNSGNQSSAPSYSPAQGTFRGIVPDINSLATGLSNYQDFSMRQAQINNVEAQTANVEQRTISEGLHQALQGLGLQTKSFELERGKAMMPFQLQAADWGAHKIDSENKLVLERIISQSIDQQNQLLNQMAIKKRLTGLDLENEGRAADNVFKQYRNQWTSAGVTSSDHPLLRIITRMLGEMGLSMNAISQERNRQK